MAAAALTNIGTNADKYYNPQALLFRVLQENAPQAPYYQIVNVPRDTTSVTQEDNEETRIDDDFSPSPIVNSVKLGSYTFTTEIADYQKDVVCQFAGFEEDATSHKLYSPNAYKEVFVEVTLVFQGGEGYSAVVLPKVQLNTKLLLESINSNVGRITVNGIAYGVEITDKGGTHNSPMYLEPTYTYPPQDPVV